MRRKYSLVLAAVCMTAFVLSGCAGSNDSETDKPSQLQSVPINTEVGEQSNTENPTQGGDVQGNAGEPSEDGAGDQSQESGSASGTQTDTELEEQLARYRQEREDTIQESNGLVEGGSPDESNYTFDLSGTGYSAQFDTREITEGYAAARIYVTDTLGIKPSTKQVVYMCVDPRILAIYDDEDKGVAAGYDNSNIFVCEYCGEGNVWQYLILVRDGKGSQWKVIHNGSSYKE